MYFILKNADFKDSNIGKVDFATGGVTGGGTNPPVTPTNYIFTLNPTPTSATVTLSATGYSVVSGTGSKSITVANGTTVNWSVSASGYTTRGGSWTISGSNKTENITLSADTGGGGNVIFDFDFTKSTLANYANDGIFTVPDNTVLDSITYDTTYGANLNNNLPNGLNFVNPIDASKAWTLEFTANFATPTDLVGNRRAFLTGSSAVAGSAMTPFVVINANTLENLGFQISNGNHTYVGGGKLTYDVEASYKITHDGTGTVTVFKNGVQIGTSNVNFANSQFEVLLGTASGKSSAYIWKDVEAGKKSYLKKIKFYYN